MAQHLLLTRLERVLDLFHPCLRDRDYFLIGGSSLLLQQVPGIPLNDIDMLVDTETAETLKEQFGAHRLNDFIPADGHLFRSNFSRYR